MFKTGIKEHIFAMVIISTVLLITVSSVALFAGKSPALVITIFVSSGILLFIGYCTLQTIQSSLNQLSDIAENISNGKREPLVLEDIKDEAFLKLSIAMKNMLENFTETEDKLSQALMKAESGAEVKAQFLATMSHEIRTPLNGIIGMGGLLAETEMTEDQQNYLSTIRDSSEALLSVINDILDYSKLEEGKMSIENTPFQIIHTVESIAELMSPQAYAQGLELATYIAPDVPPDLVGDTGHIRQILMNYLSNAIKFTPEGAIIMEVTLDKKEGDDFYVTFKVSDTGIGIPKEKQETLFERFSQVDPSHSRKYGGTGLGLAICKQLSELMHGYVSCTSLENAGTMFSATIPLKKHTENITLPEKAQNLEILQDKHVLIVDDHNFNRSIFKKQLRKVGMRCTTAPNAPAALAILAKSLKKNDPFDIAIIDHIMPSMNGDELAEHIKIQPDFCDIPLILASSHHLTASRESYRKIGFYRTLTKPVREETLFKSIADALAPNEKHGMIQKIKIKDPKTLKNARTLVVEDNISNQKFIQSLLKKYISHIDLSSDGIEAVDMAGRMKYDIILMDIHMPNMNGMEATSMIRSQPGPCKNTPIIAVTASAMSKDIELYKSKGMDVCVAKPVDCQTLLTAIEDMLLRKTSQKIEQIEHAG